MNYFFSISTPNYSCPYTIGSVYTNKNKFLIVKETLISFNSTIGILPVLILLHFNQVLVWNIFVSVSLTTASFSIGFTMFLFSLIDRDPLKHRPIDRSKENIIFLLIQELIILYGCFRFSTIRSASFKLNWPHSLPNPPFDVITRGVKLPFSTWNIRSLYCLFSSFSFMV